MLHALLGASLVLALVVPTSADCLVTDHGAKCDGVTDDTAAIQAALTSCAATGAVLIPHAGSPCMSQPLTLPSHTRLFLEPGATLKAGAKWNTTAFLSTEGAGENITISGYGSTIDGSGKQWWTGSNKTPGRPRLLVIEAVGVLLEGFTMLNPAAWCASLGGAGHRVKDVKIRSPNYFIAPNTDGIDVHAENVWISGCDIVNGDDSICIKSPGRNVLVENCTVSQGNGLVVGTSDNVNITNITFRNCTASNTAFGCHIKFKDAQAGVCDSVAFEDIVIDAPKRYCIGINQNGQSVRSMNLDSSAGVGSSVRINNISFKRIRARGLFGGKFTCNAGSLACHNISFTDVHMDTKLGGCHFSNVFGTGTNVTPASCVPPADSLRVQ